MQLVPYDLETTSNDPKTTRACQIAYYAKDMQTGAVQLTVNELCNPGLGISDGAYAIHGISNEMVKDKRPDEEALLAFYRYLEANIDHVVVATHNGTTFDLLILWAVTQLPALPVKHIDTLRCAIRCYPAAPSYKLSNPRDGATLPYKPGLTQWLGLGSGAGAHDAMADIQMVEALVQHFMLGLNTTLVELADWLTRPRILQTCHFGKHEGKPWGRGPGCVPGGYVRFLVDNFTEVNPDVAITVLHHYNMRFRHIPEFYRALGV